MGQYTIPSLELLTEQFRRLPGIGVKTAERIAYYLMTLPPEEAKKLPEAIIGARQKLHYCPICFNLTDKEICSICSDPTRDKSILCVVENISSVIAVEKTEVFRPLYHVLQGTLSPMAKVSDTEIRLPELMDRLKQGTVKEVVLATGTTVGGEITANYIASCVKPMGIRVTRLALGVPLGGDLDYTDEFTLACSLKDRKEL